MRDIENRNDIEYLMGCFYEKAIPDAVIGHFFTEVTHMDLATHLPVITNFWESILLNHPLVYTGNAMAPHLAMHARSPMQPAHFERWLFLFRQTVDELFTGDVAELAKQRAQSIATIMRIKTHQIQS